MKTSGNLLFNFREHRKGSISLKWLNSFMTDLLCKSMNWLLYDRDLRHERVHSAWYLYSLSLTMDLKCFNSLLHFLMLQKKIQKFFIQFYKTNKMLRNKFIQYLQKCLEKNLALPWRTLRTDAYSELSQTYKVRLAKKDLWLGSEYGPNDKAFITFWTHCKVIFIAFFEAKHTQKTVKHLRWSFLGKCWTAFIQCWFSDVFGDIKWEHWSEMG